VTTTFAERLRNLRRAAGLSQTELAGDGISPSYVSLLESGRRRPSPAVAALLAAKLGCSTSELLEGEPSEHERRVQLELAYAELALRHDGAPETISRLSTLLEEPDLGPPERVEATILLARAFEQAGELPRAINLLLPLFERARVGDKAVSVPRVAIPLCHCYKSTSDFNRAVNIGEQALEVCRARGLEGTDDFYRLAATVMYAYADMGDEAHALSWARDLIASAEASGNRSGQAALYWNASLLAEHEGRIEEALDLSHKAIAHFGELGDERDLARLKVASASVMLAADPPLLDEARVALESAHPNLRRLGSELDLVEWEHYRSSVALLDGDVPKAETLALAAIRRLPEDAGSENLGLAHRALADALLARGRHREAVEHYSIAADLQLLGSSGRAAALLWRDLAERLLAAGETDRAIRAYRGALDAAGVRDRTRAVLSAIAGSPATSAQQETAQRAGSDFDQALTETAAVTDQL
jgi:transcriptional regulator with XRE-family HTH domain